MSDKPLLLCKDCKHFNLKWTQKLFNDYDGARCGRQVTTKTDPVSGRVVVTIMFVYCKDERKSDNSWCCGLRAKFWQPNGTKDATFASLQKEQ